MVNSFKSEKIGQILPAHTLRNQGGVLPLVIVGSSVEGDGYVNQTTSVLDNVTATRTDTGEYTIEFTHKFPRVINAVVSLNEATPGENVVKVVELDVDKIVVVNLSSGSPSNLANDDSISVLVYFQNSNVDLVK